MRKIHNLVEKGDLEGCRRLLLENSNVAALPCSQMEPDQPLHLAAWQNQAEIAALLIEHGANLDARGDSGWTPLHYAAQHGSLETARILVDAGADLNIKDDFGFTAMLRGAYGREPASPEVAKLLRESGANADLNSLVCLGDIKVVREVTLASRLDTAIQPESLMDDAVIMVSGEVGNSSDKKPEEVVEKFRPLFVCLQEAGADVNAIGSAKQPALFTAIGCGHAALTRLLLEMGADVNFRTEEWGTIIDALSFTSGDEGKELRQILKEFGFQKL